MEGSPWPTRECRLVVKVSTASSAIGIVIRSDRASMRFVLLKEDQVRFDAASMFELHSISVGVHDASGNQKAQTELT